MSSFFYPSLVFFLPCREPVTTLCQVTWMKNKKCSQSQLCYIINEKRMVRKYKVLLLNNHQHSSSTMRLIFNNCFSLLFQSFVSSPDVNTKKIGQAVQITGDLKPWRRSETMKRKLKTPHPPTQVSAAKLPRRKSTEKKRQREMEKGRRLSTAWSLESDMKYPLDSIKVLLQNYIVPWCRFLQ